MTHEQEVARLARWLSRLSSDRAHNQRAVATMVREAKEMLTEYRDQYTRHLVDGHVVEMDDHLLREFGYIA